MQKYSLSADLVAFISFGMRAESPGMSQLGLISEKRKKIMSYHEREILIGFIGLIDWIKWQVLHGERLHLKFLASFLTMLSTQVINDSPASKFRCMVTLTWNPTHIQFLVRIQSSRVHNGQSNHWHPITRCKGSLLKN